MTRVSRNEISATGLLVEHICGINFSSDHEELRNIKLVTEKIINIRKNSLDVKNIEEFSLVGTTLV